MILEAAVRDVYCGCETGSSAAVELTSQRLDTADFRPPANGWSRGRCWPPTW